MSFYAQATTECVFINVCGDTEGFTIRLDAGMTVLALERYVGELRAFYA
jgi:hypothetical protein